MRKRKIKIGVVGEAKRSRDFPKGLQQSAKIVGNSRKEFPITFKNKEGEQLMGVFHLPEKEKPPLVVLVHGFGSTKSRRRFVRLGRALEKEGIAFFRFDFSGCGDSEGKLEETTVKKEVEELNEAIKTIFKEADLDRSKLAFVAESLGAPVALLYKRQHKLSLKTMVFWAPAFCQKKLLRIWHTEKELKEWKKKGHLLHKDKKMGLSYLKENENKDYTFLLSKINLPILILHGKKDEVVPIEFSEELVKNTKT